MITIRNDLKMAGGLILIAGLFVLFISSAVAAVTIVGDDPTPLPADICPDIGTNDVAGSGSGGTAGAAKEVAKANAMVNCIAKAEKVKCTPKNKCTNAGTTEGTSRAEKVATEFNGVWYASALANCTTICDEI